MPELPSVRLASTRHVEASGTGQPVDTVPVSAGDAVLLVAQNVAAYNGVYVAGAGQWQRRSDFNSPTNILPGTTFYVREGAEHQGSEFYLSNSSPPVLVDSDGLYFERRSHRTPVAAGDGLRFDPSNASVSLREQFGVQGVYPNPIVEFDAHGVAVQTESGGFSEGLLEGLRIRRLSANSVEILEGQAWVPAPATGELLVVRDPVVKPGLVLPLSSTIQLYLWSNGGVADVEFSTQVPASPYYGDSARVKGGPDNVTPDASPDPTRRWIGRLSTDASGGIVAGSVVSAAWATETEAGIVELATAAEVEAGAAGVLVPSAARMKAELDRRAANCMVGISVAQSIPDSAYTLITPWDVETHDPSNWRSTGAPARITPSGFTGTMTFLVVVEGVFAGSDVGTRRVRLMKNSTTTVSEAKGPGLQGVPTPLFIATLVRLTAGEFLSVEAFQTSGAGLGFSPLSKFHVAMQGV